MCNIVMCCAVMYIEIMCSVVMYIVIMCSEVMYIVIIVVLCNVVMCSAVTERAVQFCAPCAPSPS